MLHKTLDLTFRAVIPEKITRMLQEKSDENVIDRGESNEEKGIIKKNDHKCHSKEKLVNSEGSESNSEENASNVDYFVGRYSICK